MLYFSLRDSKKTVSGLRSGMDLSENPAQKEAPSFMKKRTLWLLLLVLVLAVASIASAEVLVNEADRKIKPVDLQKDGNFALNPVIEGESPTTGLPWEGRYQPILVQFDNAYGGVDKVRHWGIDAADVVYETPLASNGTTRISALFSSKLP